MDAWTSDDTHESDKNSNRDLCYTCACADAGHYISGSMCQGNFSVELFDDAIHCEECGICTEGVWRDTQCNQNSMEDTQTPCQACDVCRHAQGSDGIIHAKHTFSQCDIPKSQTVCVACNWNCNRGTRSVCESASLTYDNPDACVVCESCDVGYFISNGCQIQSNASRCTKCNVTTCEAGSYFHECTGMTEDDNSRCMPCERCAHNQLIIAPCVNGTQKDTCFECNDCAEEASKYPQVHLVIITNITSHNITNIMYT
jgi:hypothetical protein